MDFSLSPVTFTSKPNNTLNAKFSIELNVENVVFTPLGRLFSCTSDVVAGGFPDYIKRAAQAYIDQHTSGAASWEDVNNLTTRQCWMHEVANKGTTLGFWEWRAEHNALLEEQGTLKLKEEQPLRKRIAQLVPTCGTILHFKVREGVLKLSETSALHQYVHAFLAEQYGKNCILHMGYADLTVRLYYFASAEYGLAIEVDHKVRTTVQKVVEDFQYNEHTSKL